MRRLEEAANRLALDAQSDHAAAAVDLVDRVSRDDSSPPGEEAGADRESVGNVGLGSVHRALDPADDTPLAVGDDVACGRSQVIRKDAHRGPPSFMDANVFPVCKEKHALQVRTL